jgi:hypothetical protein
MAILSNFKPRRRLISAVTNALQGEVTTTEDHGYAISQKLRLLIPAIYGMTVEYVAATVVAIPATDQFTVDLNTSALDTFVDPAVPYTTGSDPSFTQAQVTPITGVEYNDTSITG